MTKSIAFVSGKGGSGKTTLALSIASIFSECGLKVLLVDCDLATNGATYFYENKLENSTVSISSFYDILYKDGTPFNYVKISENLSFIPSIKKLANIDMDSSENNRLYKNAKERFEKFYTKGCKGYDLVLFDCQAGYSEALSLILKLTNFNLAVMEADSISSAAMRSLYLKIGNIIKDRTLYQTFNKVSPEEHNVYSKISGETVFTNIEAVMFDWAIRKAFATSKLPNMDTVSLTFWEQIYNICLVIYDKIFDNSELKLKMEEYKQILHQMKLKQQKIKLQTQMNELQTKRRRTKTNFIFAIVSSFLPVLFSMILVTVYFLIDSDYTTSTILTVITSCTAFIVIIFNSYFVMRQAYNRNEGIRQTREELDSIEIELKKLQKNK